MTSANVTEYAIFHNGIQVANHRQNWLCRTHWQDLERFSPPENFEIMPYGLDEEEEYWELSRTNLKEFLDKIKDNQRKADESMAKFRADKASMDEKSFREKYNL